jgi:hypothetical protein
MCVTLLRPPTVRKLVALLRPLPEGARAAILAQAVHKGIMTRIGADQILIALALDARAVRGVDDGREVVGPVMRAPSWRSISR